MGNIRPFLAANKTKDGASVLHAAAPRESPRSSTSLGALHLLRSKQQYPYRPVPHKLADTTCGISGRERQG